MTAAVLVGALVGFSLVVNGYFLRWVLWAVERANTTGERLAASADRTDAALDRLAAEPDEVSDLVHRGVEPTPSCACGGLGVVVRRLPGGSAVIDLVVCPAPPRELPPAVARAVAKGLLAAADDAERRNRTALS